MLKDNPDAIEAEDKQKIEDGVAALKKALEADDLEAIKKEMEPLTEAVYAATTKIYQKAQAAAAEQQAAAGPEGAAQKQDDTVVDADYKVKEE